MHADAIPLRSRRQPPARVALTGSALCFELRQHQTSNRVAGFSSCKAFHLWSNSSWGRVWPLERGQKIPIEVEDVRALANAAIEGANAMAKAFLSWPASHEPGSDQ